MPANIWMSSSSSIQVGIQCNLLSEPYHVYNNAIPGVDDGEQREPLSLLF